MVFDSFEAAVFVIPINIFILWVILVRSKQKRSKSARLVVASGRIPYFGNGLEFNKEKLLESEIRYSKLGDAVEVMLASRRGIVINNVELAHEVLNKRPKHFRRPKSLGYSALTLGLTSGLFHSHSLMWNRMRRGTAPSFSIQNTKQQLPRILQQVQNWIDSLKQRAVNDPNYVFDVKVESFQLTMRVISVVTFGGYDESTFSDQEMYFSSSQFYSDVRVMFNYSTATFLSPFPRWIWPYISSMNKLEQDTIAANKRFTSACQKTIAAKRKQFLDGSNIVNKGRYLLDTLISHQDNHTTSIHMTDEEITANLKTFYLAGSETTAAVITWLFFIFSQYPALLKRVRDEAATILTLNQLNYICDTSNDDFNANTLFERLQQMKVTQATIKETMRLYGPSDGISAELEEEHSFLVVGGDIQVNRGDLVWINVDGIHRNEKYFGVDAMKFDVDRWLTDDEKMMNRMEYAFFGFGGGPRVCPGRNLAQMEMIITTALLALNFESFHLDCAVSEVKRVIDFTNVANKMPVRLCARMINNE